jgi:putative transposase
VTAPRKLLPGGIYSVTRRCSQRQFFLRPSPLVNRILLYCLARAAEKFDVQVHAFCFMSSHIHLVLSDPAVQLSEFMHDLILDIAKAMNAELRRRENLWAPGSYDHVTLEDDEAVLSAIVYTLMNPVAAGLVRHGHQWPGLRSTPRDLAGRHIVARKAGRYFSGASRAPDLAEFDLVPPPLQRELSDAQIVEVVRQKVEELEDVCQKKMTSENRKFQGRKRVLATSPMTVATTPEPLGKLNPRVAAGSRHRRIDAIKKLRVFLREYYEALEQYLGHLATDIERAREVIFPAGTYLMRVRHSVQCQAPP